MTTFESENAVRNLVAAFVAGWNAGDGQLCARPFAEDADFTAVGGQRVKGRELIGRGHDEILSTIFRGTHMSGTVNEIRFLTAEVALADVTFRIQPMPDKPWLPPHTSCGIVVTKRGGDWAIAAFRNMVPYDRPIAGPLDRELLEASRAALQQAIV